MGQSTWRCRIEFPRKPVPIPAGFAWPITLEASPSLVIHEDAEKKSAVIELYFKGKPSPAALRTVREVLSQATGVEFPELATARLKERNWVAESQKLAKPVRAGLFFVHAAHHKMRPPKGAIRLRVEARTAFGTGRHETTRGCLIALSRLRSRFSPKTALDMGCGTGIQALAIRRLWPRAAVMASDSDGQAVRCARATFRANRVRGIELVEAEGFAHPHLREHPFDLIVANILAGPLTELAGEMAKRVAEGGRIVLSGVMADQEADVGRAYTEAGFRLEEKIVLRAWPTLLMARNNKA